MKTIGLIGGMSWESSLEYYRLINEKTKKILGGLRSAKILLSSVDFGEIDTLQHKGNWEELTKLMIKEAKRLELGGADFILICTNTMHKMADDISTNIRIPLLHIGDATSKAIKEEDLTKVALLGTKFTMEEDFYTKKLNSNGIEVVLPDEKQREVIHDIIYQELCLGKFLDTSKQKYIEIIKDLSFKKAQGVVLGCTEIPLLIKQEDVDIKVFDTTKIHAFEAVNLAIKN